MSTENHPSNSHDQPTSSRDDSPADQPSAGGVPERDNYRPTSQNQPSDATHGRPSEPADPRNVCHAARRATPIVPPSVKLSNLPDFLLESDKVEGRVPTVAEARDIYIAKARASTDSNTRWSAYEGQLNKTYPRILEADGVLQRRFEGLTTAMLTRRLSPLDEKGKWLSPWELIEMLHGGGIRKSVRRTLDYHLDDFDFEYVAVTAPTRSAATPHEHIYLWVDDPGDHVSTYHLAPALEKHLKYCPNAYEKHHQFRADGTGGAITVRHEPDFTDNVPEKKEQITEASASTNSGEELPPQTGGAQYLASQLVHLPLADFYDDAKDDPLDTLMEGAAIAWVTSHRWFRASSGVPRLNSKSGE